MWLYADCEGLADYLPEGLYGYAEGDLNTAQGLVGLGERGLSYECTRRTFFLGGFYKQKPSPFFHDSGDLDS